MAITAKVRNKQIDTGKVLHALVQGENASGNITFQIIGEEELVEDFNSTYFYLLYTRPSDTRPNVLLLTNKQLQDDVISVTFKPTSYFTAEDGTVQIQIMATDTEGLSIDSETGTISGSVIWQTFPGAMFVHASQLTGTETIIEENVLTQYLAGMQELYSQTEDAEGDAADYAQLAKDWASKTNGAVEGGEMSAKYYAGTADSRAKEAEGYAVGTVSGSPSASFAGKNAKELASDAQDWAKGTRSDGKTPSHTSDNAKAYAESAADSAAIVSAHAEAIDAIGDDLTNIDAVAADILDDDSAIDAVAANITNVNAVAANETNINAVNTNKTNINTVAGKATEITTVAGIASDVSAVAAIASDVAAVEDIDDDVSAVAAIAVDVGVVADAATDIAAVADGITDVGTVATNISDVGAVASDITKIAAVADDLANIDAVADDLTNIDAAEANALKAEGYAVGTQNGTPVSGDSPYYENNAKFYGAALPGLQGQVVKLQKQIDNLNQGAGGYPEITYPDATYGTGEVPPNKAKNAQVVNLIMNSRVKNQLFPSISTQTSGNVTFTNNGDGSYTITGTTTSAVYIFGAISGVGSHQYLMYGGVASKVSLYATFEGTNVDVTDSVFSGTYNSKVLSGIAIQIKGGIDFGAGLTIRPILSDLNVHFGGTVPSDASTIAQIQTNYPELLIPSDYDTGTRVDTTYSAVKAWARNLWNEEWEVGAWNLTTGEKANSSTNIRCKNKIAVKPLTTYFFMASKIYYALFYDANDNFIGKLGANGWQNGNTSFETPANCAYVAFYMYDTYGTTYGHDICINKSDSQNGTYTPWHAPQTLTLPSPVTGKSAGSVHQIYYPETGEMTEPLGEYTITGDESFSETGGNQWIWQGFPNTAKVPATNTEKANMLCEFAVVDTYNNANVSGKTGMIALRDNGRLLVTTDIKNNWANLVGQKIIFELATPNPNSQATAPVIVDMIETEGGGRIEAVQTQETKIDSSFTIGYMNI